MESGDESLLHIEEKKTKVKEETIVYGKASTPEFISEIDATLHRNYEENVTEISAEINDKHIKENTANSSREEKVDLPFGKKQFYKRLPQEILKKLRRVVCIFGTAVLSKVTFLHSDYGNAATFNLISFKAEKSQLLQNGISKYKHIYSWVLRFWRVHSSTLRAGASIILILWFAGLLRRSCLKRREVARLLKTKAASIVSELTFSETLRRIRSGQVRQVDYSNNSKILIRGKNGQTFFSHIVPGAELALFATISKNVPIFQFVRKVNPGYIIQSLFPFVFLFVWWRVLKSMMNQNEKFKGSDAGRPVENVSFSDVVSKAKEELQEVVEFLNNPEIFKKAGARMPRGVLLVGASGTGKTLIARAVAGTRYGIVQSFLCIAAHVLFVAMKGEAQVPFISCSASEFIEMYVGRGAKRIRSLFETARRCAPSVLFIDELDAVGNRWSREFGAGHEEYVQTINQLLTELDGFHGPADGVVVIAATNRYNALDAALLRSGRFDRHVHLTLPEDSERLKIILLHAKKKKLKLDNDAKNMLPYIASCCEGFTGADLENLLNESIYYALRRNKQEICLVDLEKAVKSLLPRCKANAPRNEAQNATPTPSCLSYNHLCHLTTEQNM